MCVRSLIVFSSLSNVCFVRNPFTLVDVKRMFSETKEHENCQKLSQQSLHERRVTASGAITKSFGVEIMQYGS
jgi:hypothetical protein